jgi:mono/diheme cytochrome c family protein
VKPYALVLAVAAAFAVTSAQAGDAEIGRQLAQSRCAPCHEVSPWTRNEQADAPPFTVIARRFPSDASLILGLRGPHRKMNFRPTQREADDIAEYIHSLAQ